MPAARSWIGPISGLLLLSIAGCASAPPDGTPLNAEQIRAAVTGSPLTRCGRVLLGQWRYTGRHSGDGSMTALVLAGETRDEATGTWRATDDGLYCRAWNNNWAQGREGCFRVTRSGDKLTFDHVSGAPGEAKRYTYRLGDACE